MTNPDPQGLLRRLMAGAVGTVCEIEGTVHVHLSDEHDADAADTADVLLEVMAERERQRQKYSNGHDNLNDLQEWQGLHEQHLRQCLRPSPRGGLFVVADRTQLIQAMAVLAAHIEAIDRKTDAERER